MPTNVILFGADAELLRSDVERFKSLSLVSANPDAVICYGGDGTLLSAEREWPGVPKVPIRNSRRGNRMLDHPASEVIERLADGRLVPTRFTKLECDVRDGGDTHVRALNEVNVMMGRSNTAVRFKLWIDNEPFESGDELIGDGFLVSTPFGSTAYYRQITRGIFYCGLGVALKFTAEHVNHIVVREDSLIRAEITRGPASMSYDNAPGDFTLNTGDELLIRQDPQDAVVLAWQHLRRPSEEL
ncbi:MAG: hypothetical protein AAB353_07190 [Candidatus Hydrogenedentota bacterium]|mgnify:CR=1 FL=1